MKKTTILYMRQRIFNRYNLNCIYHSLLTCPETELQILGQHRTYFEHSVKLHLLVMSVRRGLLCHIWPPIDNVSQLSPQKKSYLERIYDGTPGIKMSLLI